MPRSNCQPKRLTCSTNVPLPTTQERITNWAINFCRPRSVSTSSNRPTSIMAAAAPSSTNQRPDSSPKLGTAWPPNQRKMVKNAKQVAAKTPKPPHNAVSLPCSFRSGSGRSTIPTRRLSQRTSGIITSELATAMTKAADVANVSVKYIASFKVVVEVAYLLPAARHENPPVGSSLQESPDLNTLIG